MAKYTKSLRYLSYIFLLGLLLLVFLYLYNTMAPLREGVVFTRYDKAILFTKPWDDFCVPPPLSCDKNIMERPAAIGSPPIGCHCKGVGNAGKLSVSCEDIDYNHFY